MTIDDHNKLQVGSVIYDEERQVHHIILKITRRLCIPLITDEPKTNKILRLMWFFDATQSLDIEIYLNMNYKLVVA